MENCLKIFFENVSKFSHGLLSNVVEFIYLFIFASQKINKDNAWSLSLIDNVSKLVAKHHRALRNFQSIGPKLDAAGRIYALRVDSVHQDACRMSSQLGFFRSNYFILIMIAIAVIEKRL